MREYRGTLTKPGTDSPHRNRSVEENLALFAKMAAGEMADGERRPLRREREEPIPHREAEASTHEGGSGVANTLRGCTRGVSSSQRGVGGSHSVGKGRSHTVQRGDRGASTSHQGDVELPAPHERGIVRSQLLTMGAGWGAELTGLM